MIKSANKAAKPFFSDKFSPQEFNQSDFGRIYFNLPKETVSPKTTEELVLVLKKYHKVSKQVRIRNTGHSVNGQTLTGGIQINVGEIKKLIFNPKKLEVTAGAGNSWHEVMQAIKFPKYCTPTFPNNPNQQIKIRGTASVGGIGFYGVKYGGFWNHVKSLKLVTITGDIIDCSRDNNSNYFKYALGGYGRIGVISELTIEILPSKRDSLVMVLPYHDPDKYYGYLNQIVSDSLFDGFMGQEQLNHFDVWGDIFKFFRYFLVMMDVSPKEDIEQKIKYIKETYHEHFPVYVKDLKKSNLYDLTLKHTRCRKADLVYMYPTDDKEDQLQLAHPWSDYSVSVKNYSAMVSETRKIIKKYDMGKYLVRQSILNHRTTIDGFASYCLKKTTIGKDEFPLSLDLPDEQKAMILGVFPNVPHSEVKNAGKMTNELTDLLFEIGGKRYLYGLHNFSKKQVEQQFGRETISQWQKIKDQLDPRHLLNIGVIEHLD